ncbi:hypothetical protein CYD53_11830 [Bosea psychrotolerans]|uniref:Uncharacterized protein n=1 Tax=Bosea psychrotolerans TaxID=1871628 RepID=A0A2S4LYN4_9HYPH|nr:hypothetical protein CYD53_11830 [Bosea psychrotolerans]
MFINTFILVYSAKSNKVCWFNFWQGSRGGGYIRFAYM